MDELITAFLNTGYAELVAGLFLLFLFAWAGSWFAYTASLLCHETTRAQGKVLFRVSTFFHIICVWSVMLVSALDPIALLGKEYMAYCFYPVYAWLVGCCFGLLQSRFDSLAKKMAYLDGYAEVGAHPQIHTLNFVKGFYKWMSKLPF